MTPQDLREALDQRGLTRQVDAAQALRTSQSSISRWLDGTLPVPPVIELALQSIPRRGTARSKAQKKTNGNR